MSAPAQIAGLLLRAFGVGLPLGLYYSFLRPLRRRTLADLLFVPALIYAWLQVGFGICGGDLRLGYFVPMVLGAILAIRLPGRWLDPAFRGFWRGLGAMAGWIKAFFREIAKFFQKKNGKNPKKHLCNPEKIGYNRLYSYQPTPQPREETPWQIGTSPK